MIRKGSFTLIIEYSLSKLGTSFIFIAWPKTPLFIYGRCFLQRLLPKIIKYIAAALILTHDCIEAETSVNPFVAATMLQHIQAYIGLATVDPSGFS